MPVRGKRVPVGVVIRFQRPARPSTSSAKARATCFAALKISTAREALALSAAAVSEGVAMSLFLCARHIAVSKSYLGSEKKSLRGFFIQ